MPSTWSWHWSQFDAAIRVGENTASIFEGARQHRYQRERGGQLFADLSDQHGISLIATPPHPADSSGHAWLELNDERCQIEITKANAKGLRLIGYWHTHPQRVPQPSPKDVMSFKAFSIRYREVLPNPVAVIVGTAVTPQGIRAWSVRHEGLLEAVQLAGKMIF